MMYYFKDKDMRYFAWTITVIIVLIIGCLIWFSALKPSVSSNEYPMTCKVVEVNKNDNTVSAIDAVGNEWVWNGVEDWQFGDCVSMIMDDNGTDEIYDDIIVSVRYSAWGLN